MSPTRTPGAGSGSRFEELDDLEAARPSEPVGDGLTERTRPADDAEERAPDATVDDQALEDPARGAVDRDGEAETDPGHGRVDADDPAARVGEGAARVARVECRVGLDDVLDEAAGATVARGQRPSERADDARRHRPGEAQRVADRDDELPDAQPLGVPERRRPWRPAGRPDDGKVRQRVAPDDLELELGAVDERGGSPVRPGHDVRRGDEVADRLDGDRRAGTARRPAADLARDAQAGDRRDQALGRRRDGDRVGVEGGAVVRVVIEERRGLGQGRQRGHRGQASPVAVVAATDLDGPLVGAAHELDLERELERGERREQVVGVGDRLPAGLDDQVAGLDPGRRREAAVLDATDEDAVTLGQPDRSAHPPRDMRWRDGHAEARAGRRLAAAQGVDPGAQLGVGRQGQVEALADPVGVEADERPVGVEQRAAGRTGRERRGVLDAAVDPPATGAAERAGDRRDEAERDARPAAVAGAGPEDRAADGERRAVAPLERGRAGGVDVDDGEVAVAVARRRRSRACDGRQRT